MRLRKRLEAHVRAFQHYRRNHHLSGHDGAILRLTPLPQRAPIWIWIGISLSARKNVINDAPLRIVGGQHCSSPHWEVFAFSADSRKLPHQGSIKPAILGLPAQSSQGIL